MFWDVPAFRTSRCPCRGWAGNARWVREAVRDPQAHHPNCQRPREVTAHAIDRYIERHHPSLDRKTARTCLETEAQTAQLHDVEHGRNRREIWRTQIGTLLVVGPGGMVETVLPMGARRLAYRPRKVRGR